MNKGNWYILKVVPGKERKICDTMNHEVTQGKLKHVRKFVCPTEIEVVQLTSKKVEREKVIYSGYLYFESDSDITEDTLQSISLGEGVTSLMGNRYPIRLRDKDIIRILMDDRLEDHQTSQSGLFNVGDDITINNGPFKTFTGIVKSINDDMIGVEVKIFGRSNLIDLKSNEIERYHGS